MENNSISNRFSMLNRDTKDSHQDSHANRFSMLNRSTTLKTDEKVIKRESWVSKVIGLLGVRHGKRTVEERLSIRQIATVPTASVISLTGAFGVMLYFASSYQINVGYALGFFGTTTLITSAWMSFRILHGLKISAPAESLACVAGEAMLFSFSIEETQGRKRQHIIVHAGPNQYEVTINPRSTVTIKFEAKTDQRGALQAPMIKLSTPHPLGLWNTHHLWEPEQSGIVYPCPELNAPALWAPQNGPENTNGNTQIGDNGDSLVALRAYQTGDSLRRVAWRIYARSNGSVLATKQAEISSGSINDLSIEDNAVIDLTNPEHRLNRLAAWVNQAHATGRPFSFKAAGISLEPATGDSHWNACMVSLAQAQGAMKKVAFEKGAEVKQNLGKS